MDSNLGLLFEELISDGGMWSRESSDSIIHSRFGCDGVSYNIVATKILSDEASRAAYLELMCYPDSDSCEEQGLTLGTVYKKENFDRLSQYVCKLNKRVNFSGGFFLKNDGVIALSSMWKPCSELDKLPESVRVEKLREFMGDKVENMATLFNTHHMAFNAVIEGTEGYEKIDFLEEIIYDS